MNEQKNYRAKIEPLLESSDERPLWSVMIPTYNCANYLRETLISVLEQAPSSDVMQIEVIDDHSTEDDPEAVVNELGKGRVIFYKQPHNVGYIKNFETCLQRSRGKIIHLLHGDDLVMYGFYSKLQEAFIKHPELGAAVSRHIFVDENGNWKFISPLEEQVSQVYSDWVQQIAASHRIQFPSIVVKRDVYEKLGGFDNRLGGNCEDWEMWARIAANYPIWYETEPLAMYRQAQGQSLTSRSIRTGQNIKDYITAINIIEEYVPHDRVQSFTKTARKRCALALIEISKPLLRSGDFGTAWLQMKSILQFSSSVRVLSNYVRLIFLVCFPSVLMNSFSKIARLTAVSWKIPT